MRARTVLVRALALGALIAGALATPGGAATPLTVIDCNPQPFPVTQNLKLANSVWNCPGDALVVQADNVTIDLNGQTIDGDSGAGDYGIDNSADHSGLTIKNGTVREFQLGVFLDQGFGHTVTGLTLVGNTNGVDLNSTSQSTIENNELVSGGSDAILLESGSQSNTILNNVVLDNNGGIDVDNGASFNVVQANRFIGNLGYGVFVAGDDNTIESNVVSGGANAGISGNSEGQRNVFKGNTVLGNGAFDGIYVGGDNFKVIGNVSSGNAADGIHIAGTADATKIKGNVTKFNGDDGISDGGTNTTGSSNKSSNNVGDQCPPLFCDP